ncbi:MAG: hypothetical protein ACK5YH_15610 [Pseudanabaena sp.]|jgi:hypothetical protein
MTATMAVTSVQSESELDMEKAKLQVTLDLDVKKSLAKYAIDKQQTMSEVVETAIKEFLSDHTNGKGAK